MLAQRKVVGKLISLVKRKSVKIISYEGRIYTCRYHTYSTWWHTTHHMDIHQAEKFINLVGIYYLQCIVISVIILVIYSVIQYLLTFIVPKVSLINLYLRCSNTLFCFCRLWPKKSCLWVHGGKATGSLWSSTTKTSRNRRGLSSAFWWKAFRSI